MRIDGLQGARVGAILTDATATGSSQLRGVFDSLSQSSSSGNDSFLFVLSNYEDAAAGIRKGLQLKIVTGLGNWPGAFPLALEQLVHVSNISINAFIPVFQRTDNSSMPWYQDLALQISLNTAGPLRLTKELSTSAFSLALVATEASTSFTVTTVLLVETASTSFRESSSIHEWLHPCFSALQALMHALT
jgi:hypothetical protein